MSAKALKTEKGFDFSKKYKVSVWVSQLPYAQIPDSYFEESFNKSKTRATNQWSKNYQIRFFNPELMETNGSMDGLIDIQRAAGECSYSSSFIANLLGKAKKLKIDQVSWIILLFDYEFSSRLAEQEKDEYTQFLGAFNYLDDADSLFELNVESNEGELNDVVPSSET